ncbi:hypothetical protein NL676_003127 [Syzygium grande]|nr:hypothetical protein NL676_003127 [Syzygium grande]
MGLPIGKHIGPFKLVTMNDELVWDNKTVVVEPCIDRIADTVGKNLTSLLQTCAEMAMSSLTPPCFLSITSSSQRHRKTGHLTPNRWLRAQSRDVGACVVTFTVGGLSIVKAIAGAYSENLPLIFIVGGPNSNDYGSNRVLHHTIGLPDFTQELRCFQTVTCHQAVVNNLEDAHEQIDTAIFTALKESKPVYISISCNLAAIPHPTFSRKPISFSISPRLSNQMVLEAAVEAAAEFLNKVVKPVMACDAFVKLADVCSYALAMMPSAKGLVPEHQPRFIRTYWGMVSTAFCMKIVESADVYLFIGPIFNELSFVGHS